MKPPAAAASRAWTLAIRLPLLAAGIASVAGGVWGGLARLQVAVPLPGGDAQWLTFHGPLMVCGFLGTVVGLERAVGLPDRWPYAAPILTAIGAVWLLVGGSSHTAAMLLSAGSAAFVGAALRVVQLRGELFTRTMAIAAVAWLVGNLFWLHGDPFPRVVPWWIAFLGLTIVGERLDLSRFQKPHPLAQPLVVGSIGVLLAGVVATPFAPGPALRVTGAGLLALAAWLGRFDIARRTVRQPGLPRFMSACLLSGYGWLALSGGILAVSAPLESGVDYDAALHSFFVGFVFSMIFGHAPVIFPSVLGLPFAFSPRFYSHVALLHVSLMLRVAGDLGGSAAVRQWGGILNGVSVALFLLNTVASLVQSRWSRARIGGGTGDQRQPLAP
jgi:hypothetical protein